MIRLPMCPGDEAPYRLHPEGSRVITAHPTRSQEELLKFNSLSTELDDDDIIYQICYRRWR